jgi:hypothetical protein
MFLSPGIPHNGTEPVEWLISHPLNTMPTFETNTTTEFGASICPIRSKSEKRILSLQNQFQSHANSRNNNHCRLHREHFLASGKLEKKTATSKSVSTTRQFKK